MFRLLPFRKCMALWRTWVSILPSSSVSSLLVNALTMGMMDILTLGAWSHLIVEIYFALGKSCLRKLFWAEL